MKSDAVSTNTKCSIYLVKRKITCVKKKHFCINHKKNKGKQENCHCNPLFLGRIILNGIFKRFKTFFNFLYRAGLFFIFDAFWGDSVKNKSRFSFFLSKKKPRTENTLEPSISSFPSLLFLLFFLI